ncbi:MAG: hypothetical protein ABJC66_18000 [Gammaproteobacteria bacterium]
MCRLAIAGFLVVFSVSGCSAMKGSDAGAARETHPSLPPAPPSDTAPDREPVPAMAPVAAAPRPSTLPVSSAPSSNPAKPKPPTVARAAPAARPRVAQPKSPKPSVPPPQPTPPPASSPATSSTSAASTPPRSLPTLNLHDLEQRLRETRAIGVFAKLSLKNQVDDLLSAFRELYRVPNKRPPAELRQRYDLLLLKVLSLLQDSDPPLATAIASSKEAIWSILADPDKFSKI